MHMDYQVMEKDTAGAFDTEQRNLMKQRHRLLTGYSDKICSHIMSSILFDLI